jgi:MerR family transcriptional regulator, light-induced transcriptional regulator
MPGTVTGGLNIAALSRRTGVAPDTLRKWEQRYGVLRPSRTPGGQRRYGEDDVSRVQWLQARLSEGYRIGEAAILLGGSETEVVHTPEEIRAALLDAVSRNDPEAIARLLDQTFMLGPLEDTLTSVVQPVLERVGESWQAGEFTVAQEHLLSGSVRARLERQLADARGGVRGIAVLACVPGERHDLGLLMLAVLLRADGWQVAYLGADTPLEDAIGLASAVSAQMLCLSGRAERAHALAQELAAHELPPDVPLVVGGAGVTPELCADLGALFVDSSLPRAVAALRKLSA